MKKIFPILPLLILVACKAPAPEKTELEMGKVLYAEHCASCHGAKGDGQGVAANYLFPKPRDLTSGVFKYRTTRGPIPSDVDILQTMKKGIPGSPMPGWDLLGMAEWKALLTYVKLLSPRLNSENPGERFEVPAEVKLSPGLIRAGEELYAKSGCTACHGAGGSGDGPAAMHLKDVWGDRILPRDLREGLLKWGNSPKDIYRTLAMGVPGTPMPSYEHSFTKDQIWSLVHYLKSIQKKLPEGFDPTDPKKTLLTVAKVDGELPLDDRDPLWAKAKAVTVYLKPLWYEPGATEWLSTKALYNDKELALLMSWEDDQANLTETQMDKAAIQFPMGSINDPAQLPYLGMGSSKKKVNIWQWKGTTFIDANASGPGTLDIQRLSDSQVSGASRYGEGSWHVIFKRPIHSFDTHDASLSKTGYLSFALWDGDLPKHAGPEQFSEWMTYELE